ncbi:MAG: hypothetical protein R3E67_08600 [Pseudomonadales bacterium]
MTIMVGSGAQAYSIIQKADGKLVAAGYAIISSNEGFALVRYGAKSIQTQTAF